MGEDSYLFETLEENPIWSLLSYTIFCMDCVADILVGVFCMLSWKYLALLWHDSDWGGEGYLN